jgi:hypothetical protein
MQQKVSLMQQKVEFDHIKIYNMTKHKDNNDLLQEMLQELEALTERYHALMPSTGITGRERLRLFGSGIKRYGFIDLVSDTAAAQPEFAPQFMDPAKLKETIREIETLRNMLALLQALEIQTNNLLLIKGDKAYRDSLAYYKSAAIAARQAIPGAETIYQQLKAFFKSFGPQKPSQPTQKQVMRDARALLHGTKEGKIIVENEKPRVIRGERIVEVDIEK